MALEISILDGEGGGGGGCLCQGVRSEAQNKECRWDSWRGLRCGSVQCFLKMFSPSSSLVPFT